MSQHSSLLLKGFIVATKISVSRQRITIKAEPVSRQSFSMSRHKVLDVGASYVATGNGHSKGFAVVTEFDHDRRTLSRQGLGCTAIEVVATGLAHDRKRTQDRGAHDKGILSQQRYSVATDLYSDQKNKKKRPPRLGASHT